jgi:NAD(P)-dependent dehydrogenase (short-subunit alcohol dehydrogenase family)
MEISLREKVAVVTGAASGIGLAVVRRYLECGAAGVVAVDRRSELSPGLAACKSEFGSRFQWVCGDVGAEATAAAFTSAAVENYGRLDVLVGNAAVSVVKPIHEHSEAEWDSVFNAGAKAMYWASRHVIPVMMRQRSGLILIAGSISGLAGIATQGAYGPSKGALHQMTRQMAIEYAKYGIRVNAIACGTIDTPLVQQSAEQSGDPEAFWSMLRRNHPIGRIGTPGEVASFYAYMASDHATFFTGSVLLLDGGYTAQ